MPDAFGVAFVLRAERGPRSLARLDAALTADAFDRLRDPALEELRGAIPAARCLPLLALLATRQSGHTTLEYLDMLRMSIEVAPCA
jgi:hypothetical protein